MKQKISYNGSIDDIFKAVQKANDILGNAEFHKRLAEKDDFDESNASGKNISTLINDTKVSAMVEIYKSAWPWSRANGYTTPLKPASIFLNSRKINRYDAVEWTATLVHEYIHLVDFESVKYYFAHGDNSRKNKGNTAPYWIDNLVLELLNN